MPVLYYSAGEIGLLGLSPVYASLHRILVILHAAGARYNAGGPTWFILHTTRALYRDHYCVTRNIGPDYNKLIRLMYLRDTVACRKKTMRAVATLAKKNMCEKWNCPPVTDAPFLGTRISPMPPRSQFSALSRITGARYFSRRMQARWTGANPSAVTWYAVASVLIEAQDGYYGGTLYSSKREQISRRETHNCSDDEGILVPEQHEQKLTNRKRGGGLARPTNGKHRPPMPN